MEEVVGALYAMGPEVLNGACLAVVLLSTYRVAGGGRVLVERTAPTIDREVSVHVSKHVFFEIEEGVDCVCLHHYCSRRVFDMLWELFLLLFTAS